VYVLSIMCTPFSEESMTLAGVPPGSANDISDFLYSSTRSFTDDSLFCWVVKTMTTLAS